MVDGGGERDVLAVSKLLWMFSKCFLRGVEARNPLVNRGWEKRISGS